jgi:hypothetical protein
MILQGPVALSAIWRGRHEARAQIIDGETVGVNHLRLSDPSNRPGQRSRDSGGTVALSAIDADPASGSALDGCRNPVFHVSTEYFSTRIWVLSVLRIGRRGLTQQCRHDSEIVALVS